MSVQEPPQFTPSQVLEAGRRAETEGRGEYAVQFYRHLVENYPGSGEAAAAQSALSRILGTPPSLSNNSLSNAQSGGQMPAFESRLELQSPVPALSNPFEQPQPYPPHYNGANGYGAPPPAPAHPSSYAAAPPSNGGEPYPYFDLPEPSGGYRSGRFLARLFAWLGGLLALAGLGLLPLSIAMPRLVSQLPLLPGSSASAAILLVFGGLLLILIGQLARALLDLANSTRDLAAISRAEAEARQPQAPPPARSRRR